MDRFVGLTGLALLLVPAGCDSAPERTGEKEPEGEPLSVEGTYGLTSRFDVEAAALLPDPAYGYVQLLADFRDEPGATLLSLADEAGVPAADELLGALPSTLESKLTGWIDQEIESRLFEGTPFGAALDGFLAEAERVVASFDLVSELALGAPDAGGTCEASHRVTALRFGPDAIEVAIPEAEAPVQTRAELTAWIERRAGEPTTLVTGDHGFGLAYGAYAYQAFEEALRREHGAGVRGLLGEIVDCPAVAAEVSQRCSLGVCVGHEEELLAICERGLDELAAELEARAAEQRIDVVRLQAGEAVLRDAGGDGSADRLDGGLWQAALDFGLGPREAPGRFTGARAAQ